MYLIDYQVTTWQLTLYVDRGDDFPFQKMHDSMHFEFGFENTKFCFRIA